MATALKKTIAKLQKDPLQTFLVFSAFLLLVLYGIESWKNTRIESAASQATSYTNLLNNNCIAHSAGLKGTVFIFNCPHENDLPSLSKIIREKTKLNSFIIQNSSTRLQCEKICRTISLAAMKKQNGKR